MQDADVTLDACELALKEKETGTKAQPQQKGLFSNVGRQCSTDSDERQVYPRPGDLISRGIKCCMHDHGSIRASLGGGHRSMDGSILTIYSCYLLGSSCNIFTRKVLRRGAFATVGQA